MATTASGGQRTGDDAAAGTSGRDADRGRAPARRPGAALAGRLSAAGARTSRTLAGSRAASPTGGQATGPQAGGDVGSAAGPRRAADDRNADRVRPADHGTPAPIVSVTVSTPVLAGSLSVSPSTVSLQRAGRRDAHADGERRAGHLVDLRADVAARIADRHPVIGDAGGRRRA